jgi:hypothetical protein
MRAHIFLAALLLCSCSAEKSSGYASTEQTTDTSTVVEITPDLHLLVEEGALALLDGGWEFSSLPVSGEMEAGGNYAVFFDVDDADRVCTEVVFADGETAGPCVKGGSGSLMEGVGQYRVTLTVF